MKIIKIIVANLVDSLFCNNGIPLLSNSLNQHRYPTVQYQHAQGRTLVVVSRKK